MKKNNTAVFLIMFGAGIVLSSWITGGLQDEPVAPTVPAELKGVFIDTPAVTLPDFTFTDQDGNLFDNANLRTKWSMVFFGYTS